MRFLKNLPQNSAMFRNRQRLTGDEAEAIAVKALGFITSDPDRLERFLRLTGWTPQSLREPAGQQALLGAVLEYLSGDESLLLTFAANASLDPASVAEAVRLTVPAEAGLAEADGDADGDG